MTPEGWRNWLEVQIEIREEQRSKITENGTIPFELLLLSGRKNSELPTIFRQSST